MHAVVVYESMYSNTRNIAEVVTTKLTDVADVTEVPLARATPELLESADLVVVGAPTHVHGMSRASTRKAAVEAVEKTDDLRLDVDAPGPGIREWFDALPTYAGAAAAAFDTRIEAPAVLTGRASKGIARELRRHGFTLAAEPESFLVTKDNHLVAGEQAHAERWAGQLSELMTRTTASSAGSGRDSKGGA
jgi:hypothetical protein